MNALKKSTSGASWLKSFFVVVVTLMPIWFAPIRTAPLGYHQLVWGLFLAAGLACYVIFYRRMHERLRNKLGVVVGMLIGVMGSGWLLWDRVDNLGDEGKLVSLYFLGAVFVWFALTHIED